MKNIRQTKIFDFLFGSDLNQRPSYIALGTSNRHLVLTDGGWYEIVEDFQNAKLEQRKKELGLDNESTQ